MNLSFELIPEKVFTDFVTNFDGTKTFLQSYNYQKFRESVGETVFLCGIKKDKTLQGVCLVQKIKSRLKTFLHCPHGPLILNEDEKLWEFFLSELYLFGKKQKADFVRVSPLIIDTPAHKKVFKTAKYRAAPVHLVNPEWSLLLDITKPEEEILKQMKKGTRYEIRQIEKYGIEIKKGNSTKDLDIFWNIHQKTVTRQKFTPFPKKNTEKELEIFGENAQIFSAKTFSEHSEQNEFLASSVILFDEHSAYYHQGASEKVKAPVAYATLWAAILEAKKRGCKYFNFWGIIDEKDKKHPWWGLSRFKRGFGGTEQKYLHCHDKPITPKYWVNMGIELYRKWKRGY